jgi:hypothetical protein
MAKFTSVLDEREDRIVFEKEDGSEFTSPRSPEANKLAAALPRKPTPTPPKVARGADPADVQQEPYSGDSRSAGPQQDPELTPAAKVWEQYGSASKDDMSYDVDRPEASPQFASDTRPAPQPTLYAEPSMPEPERVTQVRGAAGDWATDAGALNPQEVQAATQGTMAPDHNVQGVLGGDRPVVPSLPASPTPIDGVARKQLSQEGSVGRIAVPPPPEPAPQPTALQQELARRKAAAVGPVYVPGSPAVTKQMLEKRRDDSVMSPSTMQEKRSYDQAPVSPEVQAEALAIVDKQREVSDTQAVIDEERAQRDIEASAQASAAAQEEATMNRVLARRAAERVQQRMAQVEDLDSKIANWSEDPNRVFGGNVLSQIGAIIAQAIGAYAATLGGGPNHAADIINKTIDRDIAAQRAEYSKMKDARVNAYGWYVEQLGDEETAAAALKASQLKIVQAYDASVAAADKRIDVQQAWEVRDLGYRTQINEIKQNIADREHGKVEQGVAGKAERPRAARAGGYRQRTTKELLAAFTELNSLEDQIIQAEGGLSRAAREKIAVKVAELEAEAKHAGVKDETLTKFSDDLDRMTKAREATQELRALVDKYKDAWDIPGHGYSDKLARAFAGLMPFFDSANPSAVMSQQGEDLHNAANRVLSAYVFSVSGAAATDKEREFLRKALFGNTDKSLLRGLEYMENQLANRMTDLHAVYADTGAPEAYIRNIRAAAKRFNPNNDPQKGIGSQALNMITDAAKQRGGGAPAAAAAPAPTRKYGLQR